jgi:hypothetical protein
MHMRAWGLVAWHLMDKRGVKADLWEGGGLRVNSGISNLEGDGK